MTLEDVLRAPLPGRVDDVVERLQGARRHADA